MPVPTPMMETALIYRHRADHSAGPVKPEYTEDELKDPTKTPDGTPVEGTPEPQDHNNVTPPPEQPSTNTSGGLPGFDNVPNAGANQGGSIDSDGDINTQVGIMG